MSYLASYRLRYLDRFREVRATEGGNFLMFPFPLRVGPCFLALVLPLSFV